MPVLLKDTSFSSQYWEKVFLWSHEESSFKIQKHWILNDEYWNNTSLQPREEKQWTQSGSLKDIFSKCIAIVAGIQTVGKSCN